MHLKALTTPASAPGGYTWEDAGHVVEVPDELGHELSKINWQFREVLPSDPEHPDYVPPELESEPGDEEEEEDGEEEEREPELNELLGLCTGQTSEGKPCKNKAKPGQDTCQWHEPKA